MLILKDGPCWASRIESYQLSITKTHVAGEGTKHAIVLYELTTVFVEDLKDTTIVVERRYSDFQALHSTLEQAFPLIVLPQFPPKTVIMNTNHEFVERRKERLQRYMRRLVRHTALRGSDIVTTFLASDDMYTVESCLNRYKDTLQYCFLDQIIHPDWNHEEGDVSRLDQLSAMNEATMKHLPNLLQNLHQLIAGAEDKADRSCDAALAMAEFGVDSRVFPSTMSELTDSFLAISIMLSKVAIEERQSLSSSLIEWILCLEDWRHICITAQKLQKAHEVACAGIQVPGVLDQPELERVQANYDATLNVVLAEWDLIEVQRAEDFQEMTQQIRAEMISYHERSLRILRASPNVPMSMSERRQAMRAITNPKACGVQPSSLIGCGTTAEAFKLILRRFW